MLAAQIGDRHAGLMLLQDPDDLLFRKAAALHALVLVVGQNELQTGLNPRGKVTATGVQIPNLALYRSFGRLRNSIQHFTSPKKDVSKDAIEFIYGVIDPFIHQCWKLFAIDYNEDHEPYTYLVSGLIRRGVPFLVSPGLIGSLDGIDMEWPSGNSQYKKLMLGRLESLRTHKQI